jgi:hypothetical protein
LGVKEASKHVAWLKPKDDFPPNFTPKDSKLRPVSKGEIQAKWG